jgi:hypothetical protein
VRISVVGDTSRKGEFFIGFGLSCFALCGDGIFSAQCARAKIANGTPYEYGDACSRTFSGNEKRISIARMRIEQPRGFEPARFDLRLGGTRSADRTARLEPDQHQMIEQSHQITDENGQRPTIGARKRRIIERSSNGPQNGARIACGLA